MAARFSFGALGLAALLAGVGCAGDHHGPMGPSDMGGGGEAARLMSVSPQGGAVGVPTTTEITLRFGVGMAVGMEQYVDLHRGGLDGATLLLDCRWSGDRTTLTCSPHEPLQSRTTYWLHLGGGMETDFGEHVHFDEIGPMLGGQWVMGGAMMNGSHAGQPWGGMSAGWRDASGHYGMAFSFTTA